MPKNFKIAVFSLALALACSATFIAAQTSSTPGATGQSTSASSQASPGGQSTGTAGEAQAAPAHSQVDETIAWLTESVNLTPDQQNKLRPILQGEVSQMSAVNSDSTLTPEQKQQKMVDIRRAAGPQIQSVLTPEQQQKLTQMRQAQQGGASPQR
jgi:hypothetical protein